MLLLCTVAFLQSFEIRKHFPTIFCLVVRFSLGLAISTVTLDLISTTNGIICDWVYFWIRLGSIIANVVVYLLVTVM